MEQYEIPPRICIAVIQKILSRHFPERIFICRVGSRGGDIILDEKLFGKILAIKETLSGLVISINGKNKFIFEFTDGSLPGEKPAWIWGKKWAVAYERIKPDGVMHCACTGYPNLQEPYTGPDDIRLPEARRTILRSTNGTHLIEITFAGKIPIKKSYPFDKKNGIYYWTYDNKSSRHPDKKRKNKKPR